jgi:lactoylglutathione lyase
MAHADYLKVNWKKRLTDGRMKNIAFVLDPDGYWIEVRELSLCPETAEY